MKYLLLALIVFMCAPLVTLQSHPHPPIAAQVTTGIDHQQPTGDPPPTPPEPPELYPGQHEHALPPEGWFCERQNVALSIPPEHACTCERMFDPTDPTIVREDRHCSVFCHADRCKCGIAGKPAGTEQEPFIPPPDPR